MPSFPRQNGKIKFQNYIYALLWLLAAAEKQHLAYGFHIKECDNSLGMESGAIPDSAITASSFYVQNVGPGNGRLRVEKKGGAWCPKQQIEKDVREYLEIDLGSVHMITSVQTQGRYDRGRGQEYSEEFTFEYWRPSTGTWKRYHRWDGKNIFRGNSDTSTVVTNQLLPPVHASKIRILPHSIHRRTVCVRTEINGCKVDSGIVSYTIPEDPIWKEGREGYELSDSAYDGRISDGKLSGGLGQLVDGIVGGDNFHIDIAYGVGNGWIGWKNESLRRYIEMVFEFEQVRNFSKVHLHVNNSYKKNVQVFSRARILFSVGGQFYNSNPVLYSYMPDTILENSRNVSIDLHHNVGKYVKIQLAFANKWIMISEIVFHSEIQEIFKVETEMAPSNKEYKDAGGVDPPWDPPPTKKNDDSLFVELLVAGSTVLVLGLICVFLSVFFYQRGRKDAVRSNQSTTEAATSNSKETRSEKILTAVRPTNEAMQVVVNETCNMVHQISENMIHLQPTLEHKTRRENLSDSRYEIATAVMQENGHGKKATLKVSKKAKNGDEKAKNSDKIYDKCNSESEASERTLIPRPNFLHERFLKQGSSAHVLESPGSPPPPVPTSQGIIIRHDNQISIDHTIPASATKHYQTTTSRSKLQLAPVVNWNISPIFEMPYKCKEGDIVPLPRYCFGVSSKLGSCELGEIMICETTGLELSNVARIAARTCKGDAMKEIKILSGLQDPNLVRILGVCTAEQPPWLIMEYPTELGDILFYLKSRPNTKYTELMYMATQIASAMRYLELRNLVHKDLAARNCFVSRGSLVKVGDIAMCNTAYRRHYVLVGKRASVPIRWLPWESILLERYMCESTVWSFAVTLWEILTYGMDIPYPHFTDEQVIQNAENLYYDDKTQEIAVLSKPAICSPEIYELMCECWEREICRRPSFRQVYTFLKRNNVAYYRDKDNQTYSHYSLPYDV